MSQRDMIEELLECKRTGVNQAACAILVLAETMRECNYAANIDRLGNQIADKLELLACAVAGTSE